MKSTMYFYYLKATKIVACLLLWMTAVASCLVMILVLAQYQYPSIIMMSTLTTTMDEEHHGNHTLFPPYIFATSRTMGTESEETIYIKGCREMNPNYSYQIYSDDDMHNFISKLFPEFLQLYNGFPCQVMRADLWRYLIIYKYGGVYLDTDISCHQPIDTWANVFYENNDSKKEQLRAIVGVEFSNWIEQNITLQITQWAFAAAPKHHLFLRTAQLINETVHSHQQDKHRMDHPVFVTGPRQFTRAVVEYMKKNHVTPQQVADGNHHHFVGDVGIRNIHSFAPFNFGSTNDVSHPDILVIHKFMGRWRKQGKCQKN